MDTVKYLIKSNFEIDGIVEKPDIVGAIFGQTEGLLGDELDLRELQKNGRIGRIEVDAQVRGGKSFGSIIIPSSLDMVETSILAASLEIVDRVGPCDARIAVTRIEDSRNLKRKQLLARAKTLLKTLLSTEIPESKELSELVREDVKISEIAEYGADRLPCGPGIDSIEDVVFVEGRADVINLLRNNINNVVAVGGAKVGKTIAELGRRKEVTVFLDGDRGGDIILRELMNATDIDYVARAPSGMEVEELTRKELIKCLRSRIPVEQVVGYADIMQQKAQSERLQATTPAPAPLARRVVPAAAVPFRPVVKAVPIQRIESIESERERAERVGRTERVERVERVEREPEVHDKTEFLKASLKELEGSLKARLLDASGKSLGEVPIREIMKTLGESHDVSAVVLDGIVTQRLVDLAEEKRANYVVGIRAGNITRRPAAVKLILAESNA
ncbi:DNA primase [Candidatus Micrarchaeota archaeon]|nr:DNA primase [Candidatus Micrarchaeota archaeon]